MALEDVMGEALIQQNLKQFVLVLSVSLGVATLSRIFTQFREIPYSLLLVMVGLFLALFDVRLIHLKPEVTLFVFLPPLLFRTAWNLEWSLLSRDLVPICLYAVFGVLITTAGVALALNQVAGFGVTLALLVGASLSATAPAPVTAQFRQLGVNKRLRTLTEGENLFNSGIAIAAFVLLIELPASTEQLTISMILARVSVFVGIGLAVGGLIGLGISYLSQGADVPFLARALILVSAYGTYLLAEELGGSGVIAVVTAGLILGNLGARGIEPHKRQVLTEFLNFLAFFVNSIVFLLIGDQIYFGNLADNLLPIGVAIGTVILTRALSIYGLADVSNWLADCQINRREQTVLWWAGLRGSVSIALALSVPVALAQRQAIESTVFGVVLFTLLVEGLTAKLLLEKLGFLKDQSLRQQYMQAIARSVALNQILNHLKEDQVIKRWETEPQFPHYRDLVEEQLNRLQEEINQLQAESPQLRDLTSEQLRQELIAMETDIYAEFVRAGLLSQNPPLILPEVLSNESERS